MKNLFLVSLLSLVLIPAFCQEQAKAYVQQELVEVNTIDPAAVDFSDLAPIGDAIGEARIVMLGEQDHGDGATMLAKSRLVKYLHEEKGFNVLAFEGDFFALNEGWEQLPKEKPEVSRFLRENLFDVWSGCGQCADLLYDYIPATHSSGNPLQVAGFDNQIRFPYIRESLKASMDGYLQRQGVAFTKSKSYPRFLYHLDKLGLATSHEQAIQDRYVLLPMMVDTVLAQLGSAASSDFHYLVLESLREFGRASVHKGNLNAYNRIRDPQMARNLQWLAHTRYPGEKIIVWAANGHIMKNADTAIKGKRAATIPWMGTAFTRDSLNASQTYVLGFSSLQGTYKRTTENEVKSVPRPLKQGFETWIDERIAYGFVDFKPFRLLYPQYNEMFMMKPQQGNMTGNWTSVFDGIFYIRDMVPCETIGSKEEL